MDIQLSVGMANNPRTRAIFDGRVKPDGIDLICTPLHASELFWRQLHFGDFDVSEMSMSSLMMAVANGDTRWVGIPVFINGLDAHTEKLKGLRPMGTGSMMGYAFAEHVWLDA